ncbi:hypothetical protein OKA06_18275 [Novosphingobium sp. MW5]|nr:hypothetical protein [Novosphingobium sp. MW5]
MAHKDRRAPFGDRQLDDLDRAVNARAKAARGGEIEGQGGLVMGVSVCMSEVIREGREVQRFGAKAGGLPRRRFL